MSIQTLRGISTINYFAADHDHAKQWYQDFLGTEPYFERPGYVEFRVGDYQQEIGVVDSKYSPGMGSDKGRAGMIAYWHVDDLETVIKKATDLGAVIVDPPKDRGNKFVTAAVVDPFGNLLGLMHNPHYLEMVGKTKAD